MKPRHPNHVSQCELRVYATQSQKKSQCDVDALVPMFVSFKGWALILQKGVGKKMFSFKTEALILCSPMTKTCLWHPITKRMDIITRIRVCFFWWMNIDSKEMVERKASLAKPRHRNHVSQCELWVYGAQSQKAWKLL